MMSIVDSCFCANVGVAEAVLDASTESLGAVGHVDRVPARSTGDA